MGKMVLFCNKVTLRNIGIYLSQLVASFAADISENSAEKFGDYLSKETCCRIVMQKTEILLFKPVWTQKLLVQSE